MIEDLTSWKISYSSQEAKRRRQDPQRDILVAAVRKRGKGDQRRSGSLVARIRREDRVAGTSISVAATGGAVTIRRKVHGRAATTKENHTRMANLARDQNPGRRR